MLTLLVPILIRYLLEGQALRSADKNTLALHEISLQWLMKIGPKYPQVYIFLHKHIINFFIYLFI